MRYAHYVINHYGKHGNMGLYEIDTEAKEAAEKFTLHSELESYVMDMETGEIIAVFEV